MSTTIRVTQDTRRRAADIAARTGRQMQAVVDDALVAYERTLFWESFEDGFDRLSGDAETWESVQEERRGEQQALRDGNG